MLMGMMIVPVSAEESSTNVPEIMDIVYDEDGEIISFFVPVEERIMPRSASAGVYSFIGGACIVIELLSGYSCIQIARELGLALIDGIWNYKAQPYTGKWRVTYGYKPGCQPQHSGVCFGATYTKIG